MRRPRLTRSQRLGAVILAVLMIVVLVVLQTHPVPEQQTEAWRRDSVRLYWDSVHHHRDSVRQHWDSVYARNDSIKEHWRVYYDSVFHRRDSLRQYWDSVRANDSIRRHAYRDSLRGYRDSLHGLDSLYIPRYTKRDTIVELNSADTTSLCLIWGVGRYVARKILRYRYELGGYYSPEQIREIDELQGRVSDRLDTIISHLTACPDSIRRIPVNRCSVSTMARHPYIRYSQAEAIYEYRRRHLHVGSIDEIRQLGCFTEDELERISYYLSF